MNSPLISARNIHKSYMMGLDRLRVLRGSSLTVYPGEFVAVQGASGSGKSTLLHILGAVDDPDQGEVIFDGTEIFSQPIRARERFRCIEVGFIFQFYHLLPELNVFENILFPRMVASSTLGWLGRRSKARKAASEIMDQVGLTNRAKHRPSELSGGERQRAAIARALVNHPRLLLADEPTGNLDMKTGNEVLDLLARLHDRGQTIVMVTHDPKTAAYADRCVLLEDGRIKSP